MWGSVGVSEWIDDVSYPAGCTKLLPPEGAAAALQKLHPATAAATAPTPPGTSRSGDGLERAPATVEMGGDGAGAGAHGRSGKPGHSLVCEAAAPCLFNVEDDPNERADPVAMAMANPAVVARLRRELAAHTAGRYAGGLDTAATSEDRYCDIIKATKWVQPFDDGEFPPGPQET
jgi:hypothetical protein